MTHNLSHVCLYTCEAYMQNPFRYYTKCCMHNSYGERHTDETKQKLFVRILHTPHTHAIHNILRGNLRSMFLLHIDVVSSVASVWKLFHIFLFFLSRSLSLPVCLITSFCVIFFFECRVHTCSRNGKIWLALNIFSFHFGVKPLKCNFPPFTDRSTNSSYN